MSEQPKRNWRPRISASTKKKIGDVLAIWSGVILYGIYKFPVEQLIVKGDFAPMWHSFLTSWAPMIVMAVGSSVVIAFRLSNQAKDIAQTGQIPISDNIIVATPLQPVAPVPPPVPVPIDPSG